MQILFVTTSRWKQTLACTFLEPFGIQVRWPDGPPTRPEAPDWSAEIQADTIEMVCRHKGIVAARQMKAPVIVEDSGVAIAALKGFPGPYTKYALTTLGTPGFERLMHGVQDRRAVLHSVVCYCEPDGPPRLFDGVTSGRLAEGSRQCAHNPWKNTLLFNLFIPDGQPCTLAELAPAEIVRLDCFAAKQSFETFAAWFTGLAEQGGDP